MIEILIECKWNAPHNDIPMKKGMCLLDNSGNAFNFTNGGTKQKTKGEIIIRKASPLGRYPFNIITMEILGD